MQHLLSNVFGLKPLDRLQLNNHQAIRNCQATKRMGKVDAEQPYWFFQRICDDGRLEVRSPTGYCDIISIQDICDIIPCEPIIVNAMTTAAFIKRISNPAQSKHEPQATEYAPAYLVYVHKDKRGRIDSAAVQFLDPELNQGKPTFSPISQADRERLEKTINRTMLPIIQSHRNAALDSADNGIKTSNAINKAVVNGFIQTSLAGRHDAAMKLSEAAIHDFNKRKINKILSE